MLLKATGERDLDSAVQLAVGRPSLGAEPKSPTKAWKVKAPADLDAAVRQLAAERGIGLSEIVREATLDYVRAHAS